MAVAGGSPPRAYPSLFKRSPAAAHRKSGGALELGSAPGGAATVIANARSHLDRARAHLNLPPLPAVQLRRARPVLEEVRPAAGAASAEPAPLPSAGDLRLAELATEREMREQAQQALHAETEKRKAAEEALAAATSGASDGASAALEAEQARAASLEAELAEARAAASGGGGGGGESDAGEQLAAARQQLEAAEAQASEHAARVAELEEALAAERQKQQAAPEVAEEVEDSDAVLIKWLSMEGGTESLVEVVGFGALEALEARECAAEQSQLMDAAAAVTSDEHCIPGTAMVHAVVKAVVDEALACQAPAVGLAAAAAAVETGETEALKSDLAAAQQRESELQAQAEEDRAELERLREQLAASEAKAAGAVEAAAAAADHAAEHSAGVSQHTLACTAPSPPLI